MRRAFTLIELLVVISIIALLIAILLPALSAVKKSAQEIQCASDQRQLGLASHTYATDHDGVLPDLLYQEGTQTTGWQTNYPYYAHKSWQSTLGEYGAIRSNWHSVTNTNWNRDNFWNGTRGSFIFGRFGLAGDAGNSHASRMTSYPDSGYNTAMRNQGRKAFAASIEDNPVLPVIWTDLSRANRNTGLFRDAVSNGQGSNHMSEDAARPDGTHHTHFDGSTTFVLWNEARHRFNIAEWQMWW